MPGSWSGLAVLLKICGRMSVVMLLPSLALSTVTGLNVYLSIALMGVTALSQKRWLLVIGGIFAVFGLALGVSGFMGYNIHPSFLAKLLG